MKRLDSPARLGSAVRRYFAGISYDEPVYKRVPVTQEQAVGGETITVQALDSYGHPLYRLEAVMHGKRQAMATQWIEPPSLPGLLLALGMSDADWLELRQQAGYEPICMRAEQRIEAFHIRQLATSRASGAKYALGCKFGWNDAAPKDGGVKIELDESMNTIAK